MTIDAILTDKRIQKLALAQGRVSKVELKAHMEALPDRSDQIAEPEADPRPEAVADQAGATDLGHE